MSKYIIVFVLSTLFPFLAHALKPSDFFTTCLRGPNSVIVTNIDDVLAISSDKVYKNCPREIIFDVNNKDEILSLVSVRDGVRGGQYSPNYEDIQLFVACGYQSFNEMIGCDMQADLISESNVRESTLENMRQARENWLRRNH